MALLKEVEDLLAGLKLTDDERKQAEALLGSEERQNEIKRGYHGAAESDRLMTQAKQAEAAAVAKAAEADEKIAGWLKWYEEENPKVAQYQSQAETERQKTLMLSNYLVSQGIDPTTVPGLASPAAVPPPATPNAFSWKEAMADPEFTKTFIPRAEAMQTAETILQLTDEQHAINLRHRKLFGSDIEDYPTLRQEAMAAKKQLIPFADEKYGFSKKEQELADKALEDRAQKMAEERYAALVSRTGLPQPTADLGETAVFSDNFAAKGPMSEGDADRAAIARAMAFQQANPNHAADVGDMNI